MEWAKVTEYTPPFDTPVLVYCRIYGRYVTCYTRIADTDCGQWEDWEGRPGHLPPTHWMPLPEIPVDQPNEKQ